MNDLEKRANEFYLRVVESSVRGLYTGPDIGLVMFVKAISTEHELGRKEGLEEAANKLQQLIAAQITPTPDDIRNLALINQEREE